MAIKKPTRAVDYDPSKTKWPKIGMPKIDGVRLVHLLESNGATSRELKPYANAFTTEKYSDERYCGFDGELTLTGRDRSPDCCRKTTSAVTTKKGNTEPDTTWHLFDYIGEGFENQPYDMRYAKLVALNTQGLLPPNCAVVPAFMVSSEKEYDEFHEWCLMQGYEGSILRDPKGKYKQGYCTVLEGFYLRRKDFIDEEAYVLSINEAMENTNEQTISLLGYSVRSSHQENLIPKGMVGSLNCWSEKWGEFVVSRGEMDEDEAIDYFQNPNKILRHQITFKYFPKGIKDKPRFPTFKSIRANAPKLEQ